MTEVFAQINWTEFLSALLVFGGTVVTALCGVLIALLSRQHKTMQRVRDQVENDHVDEHGNPINLRDNIDANQAAVMAEFRGMRRDIGRLDRRDIERGVEIRDLTRKLDKHLDWSAEWSDEREKADDEAVRRLDDLEDTINPGKEKP